MLTNLTTSFVARLRANDEAAWGGLLALAKHPQVMVKVSALFRVSAELPPHRDLQPRVAALIGAFGPARLMWGSDFPFVTVLPARAEPPISCSALRCAV